MAIVQDASRIDITQRGLTFNVPDAPEEHINEAYQAGVNNTADEWVPHVSFTFNDATPGTTRF